MELIQKFRNKGLAMEFEYSNIVFKHDFPSFLFKEAKPIILKLFRERLRKGYYKFSIEVQVTFRKLETESPSTIGKHDDNALKYTDIQPWFRCKNVSSLQNQTFFPELIDQCLNEIQSSFDIWVHTGSGYFLEKIDRLHMTVARFIPLSGGKRLMHSLPSFINKKNCITKIITRRENCEGAGNSSGVAGDQCFIDCVRVACTIQKRNTFKGISNSLPAVFDMNVSTVVDRQVLDDRNLTYPTNIQQIKLFEERNKFLCINVFSLNRVKSRGYKLQPRLDVLYHSKESESGKIVVDLLYHKKHFYLIRNLSRVIARQRTSYICRSCLTVHSSLNGLIRHKRYCDDSGTTFRLPDRKEAIVKFEKLESLMLKPFAIYFDIESALPVIPERQPNSRRKFINKHVPVAIGAIRLCISNPDYNSELFMEVGYDCIEKFLDWLELQSTEIDLILDTCYQPLVMTDENWTHFHAQEYCGMCGVEFTEEITMKVRHHDHLKPDNNYLGAYCTSCNLARATQTAKNVPVIAHNFGKYDAKLLLRCLSIRNRQNRTSRFKVIQKSAENNIVIFFDQWMFLDSYNWLSSSLRNLIEIRLKDEIVIREHDDYPSAENDVVFPLLLAYAGNDLRKYKLLCRKQVFPYNMVTSQEALLINELPEKSQFYDDIKKEDISEQDWQHACDVWRTFECKTLEDFLRIYLSVDVLTLGELFENYRKMSHEDFSLDPTYYFSLAHFSFNAMLKYTNVEFELIQDLEIYNFIRANIRGGLTFVGTRYAEANLPHLDNFDPEKPRIELKYFDARGLYAHCLRRPLPIGEYRWLTDAEIREIDLIRLGAGIGRSSSDEQRGFIFEVDLSFPDDTHDYFRDFTPLPEHKTPDVSQWTQYQQDLAKKCGQARYRKTTKKLISHLGRRLNYVIHGEHLRVCLKLGVQLDKIHRVLCFKQAPWARPYIDYVAEKRKHSQSTFESNNHKLTMNSIFGYFLCDASRRADTRIVNTSKQLLRLTRKPTFKNIQIYDKQLACVDMQRSNVLMKSPLAAGFTILELSKRHMVMFWYNFLKKVYPEDGTLRLLLSDTDSFIISIKDREPALEMMKKHRKYFDLSECPAPFASDANAMKVGSFKDELGGKDEIVAFCGLRTKSYCLKLLQYDDKKAKGLPKNIVRDLDFDDYYHALFNPEDTKVHHYVAIRSLRQELFTIEERKTGLSGFDDKRILLENQVDTVPYYYSGQYNK